MASILNEETSLHRARVGIRRRRWIIFFAAGVAPGLAVSIYTGMYGYLPVFGLLGFGAQALLVRSRQTNILSAGIAGEAATLQALKRLPEGYYVLNDFVVTGDDGSTSQVDHCVVGPNGVFVIETKNLNGTVKGDMEAHNWRLVKTSRRGGRYERSFYNPTKQVGTHVYRVKGALMRTCRFRGYVQGVVVFTHLQTELKLSGRSQVAVLTLSQIVPYIVNHRPERPLSSAECKVLAQTLKGMARAG